ncbi:MAG: alpha-glucosidase C-terminal domain-containing protein, partial [bacterium]
SYKKLILYMAYMNTIPGLPVIYYGSEFGMSGATDPDNRRMMRFNENLSDGEKNTLQQVRQIINLRKEHSALRYGDFYTIRADQKIFAYVRSDANEIILVVLNKSNNPQELNFNLPVYYELKELESLKDKSRIRTEGNTVKFKIDSRDWQVFILR